MYRSFFSALAIAAWLIVSPPRAQASVGITTFIHEVLTKVRQVAEQAFQQVEQKRPAQSDARAQRKAPRKPAAQGR